MSKFTDEPIRIGISGAPGVGKTTLIEYLTQKLMPYIEVNASMEIARTLSKKGVKINTDSQFDDYLAFIGEHFKNTLSLRGDIIFYDRSIIDVYAFMALNGHDSEWLKYLVEEMVKWQMSLMTLYCYIPPEINIKYDGVRIVDTAIIESFDSLLLNLLKKYRPSFITLTGSISARAATIVEQLYSSVPKSQRNILKKSLHRIVQ